MSEKTEVAEPRRIVALNFVEAVLSLASARYVAASKTVSIVPAVLKADGDWRACDKDAPTGFGIRRFTESPRPTVMRTYVPMHNVSDVSYGE